MPKRFTFVVSFFLFVVLVAAAVTAAAALILSKMAAITADALALSWP